MNKPAQLILTDDGYIFLPPVHLSDDEAHRIHSTLSAWVNGESKVLVLPYASEVLDLRKRAEA